MADSKVSTANTSVVSELGTSTNEGHQFNDGDIVWVKWHQCWWPAEVKSPENVPDDIMGDYKSDYKRLPFAFVKFFDEDAYEYVRDAKSIFPYNCEKKIDFLKKGIAKYRAKERERSTLMKKFPDDVARAEKILEGDPDILSGPEFTPQKGINYKEIFGDPNEKKKKALAVSGTPTRGRGRKSATSPTANGTPTVNQRIMYKAEHDVRIRQQLSMSTRISDDESSPATPRPGNYTCHVCGFESTRLNVIILHNKSHTDSPAPKVKRGIVGTKKLTKSRGKSQTTRKTTPRAPAKRKATANSGPSSESTPAPSAKKQRATKTGRSKQKSHDADARNSILADWDEEENSDEEKGGSEGAGNEDMEIVKVQEKGKKEKVDLDKAFEALLGETAVPTIPSVPELSSKCLDNHTSPTRPDDINESEDDDPMVGLSTETDVLPKPDSINNSHKTEPVKMETSAKMPEPVAMSTPPKSTATAETTVTSSTVTLTGSPKSGKAKTTTVSSTLSAESSNSNSVAVSVSGTVNSAVKVPSTANKTMAPVSETSALTPVKVTRTVPAPLPQVTPAASPAKPATRAVSPIKNTAGKLPVTIASATPATVPSVTQVSKPSPAASSVPAVPAASSQSVISVSAPSLQVAVAPTNAPSAANSTAVVSSSVVTPKLSTSVATDQTTTLSGNATLQADPSGVTYVLVTIDDSSGLADGIQSDGTQMLYIDSSSLTTDEMGNLILAIDPNSTQVQPGATEEMNLVQLGQQAAGDQDILAVALANTQVLQPEVAQKEAKSKAGGPASPRKPVKSVESAANVAVISDHAYSETPVESMGSKQQHAQDGDDESSKRMKTDEAR